MSSKRLTDAFGSDYKVRVPILLYHRITDDVTQKLERYCVSPRNFQQQMSWLKSKGYVAIPLGVLADHYRNGFPLPARPVVITFDDGYEDNLHAAYPVLESLGFQAVVFLVAGLVGKTALWDACFGPPAKLLSWRDIRTMAKGPIVFGAHTVSHPHLCQISPAKARDEVVASKAILEDKLGWKIKQFAYPYSDLSPALQEYVAEAGYQAACCSIWGLSDNTDSVYALRRVMVGRRDSLGTFARNVQGITEPKSRGHLRPLLRKVKALAFGGAAAPR